MADSNLVVKTPLVEMRGIVKRFPGVTALSGVSFSLMPGEILALIGENGSGKSTLIKILSGVHQADEGEILICGKRVNWRNPSEAQKKGIATIHQELNLIPNMDVASNMFLNWEPMTRRGFLINFKEMYQRAKKVLETTGVPLDPRAPVAKLSVAEKQLVEIAKAMAREMRVLILDEPTAALPAQDVERLFEILGRLKKQGIGIIYISHRLEEIERLADRVTVIRDGYLIATKDMADLSIDEIIRMMAGRDVTDFERSNTTEPAREVLKVEGLSLDGVFHNVNLCVRRGEILGMAGLVGSGRSEVASALGGALTASRGRILVDGAEAKITSPSDALKYGIGLLPSERKAEGLATLLSVRDNIVMASLKSFSGVVGLLLKGKLERVAQGFVAKLGIKIASLEQRVGNLSGGNQQKVVLAKVLARGSQVLVFDEPTRGIDVGTRREIYTLMDELAAKGNTIVNSSSDLPELLQTCDRIVALYKGRVVGEFSRGVSKEEVLRAILGHGSGASKSPATGTAESQPVLTPMKRSRVSGMVSQALGVPLLILALILFFGLKSPRFLSNTNIQNLSLQLSILLLLASAQAFAIITRGVDMSIGSNIALVSMVLGIVGIGTNMVWGMAAGIMVALVLGLLNGLIIGGMRVDPFIITLSSMYMARGFALMVKNGQPVYGFPRWFSFISDGQLGPVPFLVILALVFAAVCQITLTRTRFGRHLAAIGGNTDGARIAGVNVGLRTGAGYVMSALLAGVAGIVLSARLFSGQPTLGSGSHLEAITAAIIGGISLDGGRGDIVGVAMGVLVIGILSNGMNIINVPAYTQLVIMGGVLNLSLIVDRLRLMARQE